MKEFVSFKKYTNAAQARETQQLLETNGIVSRLADNNASVDSNFGKEAFIDFEVQLYPSDFERAETLLEEQAGKWIAELPEDYYLFSFNDEELYEIVQKKDEWSEIDYVLAKRLLVGKGNNIDYENLRQLQKNRLETLAKPDDLHFGWIIAGYVFAVLGSFIFWAWGMIVGVTSGYFIYTSKKVLPDGSKVNTYNDSVRLHGRNIFILGIVIMVISVGYRVKRSLG